METTPVNSQRRFARISAVALAAALSFGSALAAEPIKIGVAEALSGGRSEGVV